MNIILHACAFLYVLHMQWTMTTSKQSTKEVLLVKPFAIEYLKASHG